MRARVVNRRWLWPLAGVAAFVVACLLLGWWQWDRAQSASGTMRNLAYALEWPSFAGFAIYMLYRVITLERADAAGSAEPGSDHADDRNPLRAEGSTASSDTPEHSGGRAGTTLAAPTAAGAGALSGGGWTVRLRRLLPGADAAVEMPTGPVRIGPPRPAGSPSGTPEGSPTADGRDIDLAGPQPSVAQPPGAERRRPDPDPDPDCGHGDDPDDSGPGEPGDHSSGGAPDDVLTSYNQYLARLHAADQQDAR